MHSLLDTPVDPLYLPAWPAACEAIPRPGKEIPTNDRYAGTHHNRWRKDVDRSDARGCDSPRQGSRSPGGRCALYRSAWYLAALLDSVEGARGRHLYRGFGI